MSDNDWDQSFKSHNVQLKKARAEAGLSIYKKINYFEAIFSEEKQYLKNITLARIT